MDNLKFRSCTSQPFSFDKDKHVLTKNPAGTNSDNDADKYFKLK
jgi:hypothetical protein